MSSKIEEMVSVLRKWQGIERESMNVTAEIMEKTDNVYLRMIMEVIRHDSLMHHRVQQFLIDSVTVKDVTLTREEVGEVWSAIEEHDKAEQETIKLAEELMNKAWSPLHKHLLAYLLTDERKHDALLEQLGEVKSGMTKASGA